MISTVSMVSWKRKFEWVLSIGGSTYVVWLRDLLICSYWSLHTYTWRRITSGQPEPIVVVAVCAINTRWVQPSGVVAYSNRLDRTTATYNCYLDYIMATSFVSNDNKNKHTQKKQTTRDIRCIWYRPSKLYNYGYSLPLLRPSTHASNFAAGAREFSEFDPHRQLGQLLQCSVQRVSVCWLRHGQTH